MGLLSRYTREKLVVGILTSRPHKTDEVVSQLTHRFGPVDFSSRALPFEFTRYYDREMGTPITRLFVSFKSLVDPDFLAAVKLITNEIERMFSEDGLRKVNLDPGLLALSRFALATTKEGSHRLALGSGIYGEVTLTYVRGRFTPLPWTYPDFRSETYHRILTQIRDLYHDQLRQEETP